MRTDLQEILDGDPKPFVYMPNSSRRLALRVDKPEEWTVVTSSAFIRDLLSAEEMNPGGMTVMTNFMAVRHGIQTPNLLVYGVANMGAKTKFAMMTRRLAMSKKSRVLVISSTLPDSHKLFWFTWALGLERQVFGTYDTWMREFCHTMFIRGTRIVTGLRDGVAGKLANKARSFATVIEAEK